MNFFIISGVVTFFGRALRCSSSQFFRPRLNSETQYFAAVNEAEDSEELNPAQF